MEEPQKHYVKSKKNYVKPDAKHYILLDSIYVKYPEEANLQRQKADQPGVVDGSRE